MSDSVCSCTRKDQPDVLHTEYFLVACFGVLVVAGLTGENQAKGIFAALFGLLIGCIGMDSISGVSRFTFWTALAGGRT